MAVREQDYNTGVSGTEQTPGLQELGVMRIRILEAENTQLHAQLKQLDLDREAERHKRIEAEAKMTDNAGSTESTAALSLRGTVAEWLGDKLILQQFTHENCPPERDITTCPRDSDGKHRPCMECWLEFVLEQTDKLLVLLSQHGVRIVRSADSKVDVCSACTRAVCDGFADYVCVRPLVEKP